MSKNDKKTQVKVTRSKLDKYGNEIYLDEGNNMITDLGLLRLAYNACSVLKVCYAGTGTSPNFEDGGAITLTIEEGTVTSSLPVFVAEHQGELLQLEDGSELRILGYISPTQLQLKDSVDIATPNKFRIWYVSRTTLDEKIKGTSYFPTEEGDNGTTYDYFNRKVTFWKTFIFGEETEERVYTEIAYSHYNETSIVGRHTHSGDTIDIGERYKIKIEVTTNIPEERYTEFEFIDPAGNAQTAKIWTPRWTHSTIKEIGDISSDSVDASYTNNDKEDFFWISDETLPAETTDTSSSLFAQHTRRPSAFSGYYRSALELDKVVVDAVKGETYSITGCPVGISLTNITFIASSYYGSIIEFSQPWDKPSDFEVIFTVQHKFARVLPPIT